MSGVLCDACEVEEPQEMICDNKDARCNEAERRQRDEWPAGREVLEIYDVTEDGEEGVFQGQRVREIQQNVEKDDGLHND